MEMIASLVANKYVFGGLVGLVAAAKIDYEAFQSWQSVDEALSYNWGVAGWRWFKGFVAGVVAASGTDLGALLG